jgi:surface carbohydrate biosynthesis protein (TIGR04326 family)
MTALVVFDETTDVAALARLLRRRASRRVLLCGFTSDSRPRTAIVAMAAALPTKPAIEDVDTVRLVCEAVETFRTSVVSSAAELGTLRIGGRTVRKWLLPQGAVDSSWWYSLVAEHNPLLTETYLVQAQIAAVERVVRESECDRLILAAGPGLLRDCLSRLTDGRRVSLVPLNGGQRQAERRERWRRRLEATRPIGACWVQARRAWRARRMLGEPRPRHACDALVVTYFPALANGTDSPFSRYLAPVEDLLTRNGWTLRWLGHFTPLDGATFEDALQKALAIRNGGADVELLDQWMTPFVLARAAIRWVRHVVSVLRIWKPLVIAASTAGPGLPVARPAVVALLWQGLLGARAFRGVLFAEAFRTALAASPSGVALYPLELQPWEAALNAARRTAAPRMRTIGFQHTVVPRHLFNYLHSPAEFDVAPDAGGLPLPDVIAVNGPAARERLSACGYPEIREVEAVRHGYLSAGPALQRAAAPAQVLIVGPAGRLEARALVSLTLSALAALEARVLVKAHPGCPLDTWIDEAGGLPGKWELTGMAIADLLPTVRAVIVSSSSVSVEALAMGCRVIQPMFCDVLTASPLEEPDAVVTRVYTLAELHDAVQLALRAGGEPARARPETLARYWTIDSAMPRWRALLGIEPAAA